MAENNNLEFLKAELNARLEEYKALRAEIVATLTAAFQTTVLTLTATGTLVGSAPFIVKYDRPVLFVVASFVFYILAWTQLRYLLTVYNISQHIIEVVSPGIRDALRKLSEPPVAPEHLREVLSWEQGGRARIHPKAKWAFPIEAARYGVPLLVGLLSTFAYVLNIRATRLMDNWDRLLTGSSLAVLGYTVALTFIVRSILSGHNTTETAGLSKSQLNQVPIPSIVPPPQQPSVERTHTIPKPVKHQKKKR